MATEVTLVAGSIPVGFCFSTYQDLLNQFVSKITASISGTTNNFNYGSTTPNADQRDRPWHRTDAAFTPDRVYTWSTAAAAWVAPHAVPPGVVWLYTGDIALLDTFDGGEPGAATTFTGVMWEKLSAINGRVPIGPGTMDQSTVVAIAGTGGTEKVALTTANLASHQHDIKGYSYSQPTLDLSPTKIIIDDDYLTGLGEKTRQTELAGSGTAHENMPPYYGVWFIKKSIRTHYRV